MAQTHEVEPMLGEFLALLDTDMMAHPERVLPIEPLLIERARMLVAGVEINLDAPLADDDE